MFQFDNPGSDLARKINKHTALITDDLDTELKRFIEAGYELAIQIDEHGDIIKRYAYVTDGANFIELCEER